MDAPIRCCCGIDTCPALLHSRRRLNELNRDLATAADLGQALLARHEAYVAEAEEGRRKMTEQIEQMECDKAELERRTARAIDENRSLLNQLEDLNKASLTSDSTIRSLSMTLESTQEELRRLTVLASRAETLERQLAQLEREQAQIQETLATTAEQERIAIQQWRNAEKTIALLQEQVEQIENEAQTERERHSDLVARTERRVSVESAFDRLSGKVKASAPGKATDAGENRVVSNFVRDILQDNANLQLGIVELREMLMNSNEEVERLREQIPGYQPAETGAASSATLENELSVTEPVAAREVHVHHHYHAAPDVSPRLRVPVQRRPKKKRFPGLEGHHTRSCSSRTTPATPSSAAAILSQTLATIPNQRPPRWSLQSLAAISVASSFPSSPYSPSRPASSIFDRAFSDTPPDSSRPTSPESLMDASLPTHETNRWRRYRKSLDAIPSMESLGPGEEAGARTPTNGRVSLEPAATSSQQELSTRVPHAFSSTADTSDIPTAQGLDSTAQPSLNSDFTVDVFTPRLRRAASHDSILSLALAPDTVQPTRGQLTGQPSALLGRFPNAATLYSTPVVAVPSSSTTTEAIFAGSSTLLRPSVAQGELSKGNLSLSILRAASPHGSMRSVASSTDASASRTPAQSTASTGLTRKVGGWVWGKWGVTPTPTVVRSVSAQDPAQVPMPLVPPAQDMPRIVVPKSQSERKIGLRPTGVNQPGWIWGFQPEPPTPYNVEPTHVDSAALGDALATMAQQLG